MENKLNKQDYQEDVESLVTFGEEGQTFKKDDPRTKEYVSKKNNTPYRSIFDGLDMSNKRNEGEDYEDYKIRRKINNNFLKMYKQLGKIKVNELYPMGFKYALDQFTESQKNNTPSKEMSAKIVNDDGTESIIPVTIKNK